MTTRAAVDDFLAQHALAVVGVSRSGKGFGNTAYRELRAKGYRLFPLNPNADSLEGERCYPSLSALAETEKVVQDAAAVGIRRVWMQ